ncbi:hypothetical protein [Streptomyces sp. NBC_01589]|uniref:hypothetical protein n=1 Tax=unclassified Streptomyces TaxID=2593676 RepID=UPI00386EF22B
MIVGASLLTWCSTDAERDRSAPFDTYSTGGANVHWLRPLLPGIWLSMFALIYTSHSAATPAWAFVGAILIVLAVGRYIRMNLT